jgi:hypothetical protein
MKKKPAKSVDKNICDVCGHFNTSHDDRGCRVNYCDCSKRVKTLRKDK